MSKANQLEALKKSASDTLRKRIQEFLYSRGYVAAANGFYNLAHRPSCIEHVKENNAKEGRIVIQHRYACGFHWEHSKKPTADEIDKIVQKWMQETWTSKGGRMYEATVEEYTWEHSDLISTIDYKSTPHTEFHITIGFNRIEPLDFRKEFTQFISRMQRDAKKSVDRNFIEYSRTFFHEKHDGYCVIWNLVCNTKGFDLAENNEARLALYRAIEAGTEEFSDMLKAANSDMIVNWDMDAHHHRREDGYLLGTMFSICFWARQHRTYGEI